jgi:hypothetical protein
MKFFDVPPKSLQPHAWRTGGVLLRDGHEYRLVLDARELDAILTGLLAIRDDDGIAPGIRKRLASEMLSTMDGSLQ